MFEFVDLVLAFLLGALTTAAIIYWLVQRWLSSFKAMLEQALEEATKTATDSDDLKARVESGKIVLLEVEVENNEFFCYNSKTHQFVCQGRDVGEIIENFKQRFPGLNAVLHTGDEEALKTLRQQLKEHRETSDSIGSSS